MSKVSSLEVIRAYVKGQADLGYMRFDPAPSDNDVILTTFPKSGSTWVSYLLYQIKSYCSDEFDDIKNVVVDITPGHWKPGRQAFAEKQDFLPRTFKTHGSYRLAPKGAKYIYVGREPKDIFWSLYQFIHDLLSLEEPVPVDQFYREYFIERFGTGHDIGNVWDHIIGWYSIFNTDKMLWLHYEDLVESTRASLEKIIKHMGVSLDPDQFSLLLDHSRMDHMRSIASKIDPSPDNYVGKLVQEFGVLTSSYARNMRVGKLRKGLPGDGSTAVPEEIRQEIDKEWRSRITPVLGFVDYDQMRKSNNPAS